MAHENKVKITMYGRHVCWLRRDLLEFFDSLGTYVNISVFIKEITFKYFGFYIRYSSDIDKLDELVKESFFEDKSQFVKWNVMYICGLMKINEVKKKT